MNLTKRHIIQWLQNSAAVFERQRDYLTELDTAIGDADHGLNMQRGFSKVLEKLPTVADQDIAAILKSTGMTLLSSVGGASGPLFGTFFIKAAQRTAGQETLDLTLFQQMLQDGVDGIVARGRAEAGDKTLCDVWLPVLTSLTDSERQKATLPQALQSAVETAESALAATIPMKARKGRASYLNERSIGHQDPGATSVLYLLQALSAAVREV
ncbi:dihydroxyacetone kinase [Chelonobacter oris]|uniref:Dihydroxyacetone kinase n=1 Tax=Chelonobacter oris TaxID=505317 RepID=A0A0A3AS35_9PAST|nr:dihydroxyacetone kinase subunit DhaL [Chelonobacter oris]KGQ70582.1 dihydroxyacetone kinase [Chelonobacter oris]